MQTLRERTVDLSVIIPVYNLEQFLQPMLDSLKAQELGNYNVEFIFVLNNCTDKSEDVIRASGLDCTIINCTTQGCGPARNAALDIAFGEYIWMMDGDDWLLTTTAIRDALGKITTEHLNILRIQFASNSFPYPYFSMVWQYVIRRDFIGDIRFPAKQPGEDDDFMQCILNKAGYDKWAHLSLPCILRPLYYYNFMREGSNMFRVAHGEGI